MSSFLEYLNEAMRRAEYERMEGGEWFAKIPGFEGLWASGKTIEDARNDLWSALDGWLYLNVVVARSPLPDSLSGCDGA